MNDICPVYKSWGKHPEHHDRLHARISSLEADVLKWETARLNEFRRAEAAEKERYQAVELLRCYPGEPSTEILKWWDVRSHFLAPLEKKQ